MLNDFPVLWYVRAKDFLDVTRVYGGKNVNLCPYTF